MPFLTEQEFRNHVGEQLGDQLANTTLTFEAAERGAQQTIVRITGISVPGNAADAPDWTKEPAAYLIVHSLSGQLNWSEERRQWARERRRFAIEELRGWAEAQRDRGDDDTDARTGLIDHMIHF